MTTIQDRLREGCEYLSDAPAGTTPDIDEAATEAKLSAAADRIDALENALALADAMVESSKTMKYGEAPLGVFINREKYREARAALGEPTVRKSG